MLHFGKKILLSLLISLNVFFAMPEQAQAIPVFDAANATLKTQSNIVQTLSTAYENYTSFLSSQLTQKEFIYDKIQHAAVAAVRRALVKSVIDWVKGGFKGSPAFAQNLNGYLQKVGDDVASDFIKGSGLDALCEPFKLNVRGALALEYGEKMRKDKINKCTFTTIGKNIHSIEKDAKKQLSSDDLFRYTANPVNSPQGAYLDAKAKLGVSLTNAKGEEVKLLEFGGGFLSKKECKTVNGKELCSVVTPGDSIKASLNKSLGLGADSLVTADELGELIDGFTSMLLSSALKGLASVAGDPSTDAKMIGFDVDMQSLEATETVNVLNKIIPTQISAVNGLQMIENTIATQCYIPPGDDDGNLQKLSLAEEMVERERQYSNKGILAFQKEIHEKTETAVQQRDRMRELLVKAQQATSTNAIIVVTQEVSKVTQASGTYIDASALKEQLDAYAITVNNSCPRSRGIQ